MAGNPILYESIPGLSGLRAYTVTGSPHGDASTANVTNIYAGASVGNFMYLPRGGIMSRCTLASEATIALGTSTANRGRDIWAYADGNSVAFELGTVWDSGTARATGQGITVVDGVPCRESDTTRVLFASYYLTSTTQTQDTFRQRLVWNAFNQIVSKCFFTQQETSAAYSYTSTTVRQMGATATNQIEVFSGLAGGSAISLTATHMSTATNDARQTGIGVNSTSVNSADTGNRAVLTGGYIPCTAWYRGRTALGFSYYAQLEWVTTGNAGTTWHGNNSGSAERAHGTSGFIFQ